MRSVIALALVASLVPAPSPLAGNARSEAAATHRAEVILDRVVIPGGEAEAVPQALSYFGAPFPLPVEVEKGWTVAGEPEALMHDFRVHPPRGFRATSQTWHTPASPDRGPTTSIFFEPADRPNSQMQELALSARDMGHGTVEVLAQATVAWIPARSRAEAVPPRVTGATVLSQPQQTFPGQHLLHQVMPADVVRIGRALNRLPPTHVFMVSSCPLTRLGAAILTVKTLHHTRLYEVPLDGCPFVTVTVDGIRQPDLSASARLRSLLSRLIS